MEQGSCMFVRVVREAFGREGWKRCWFWAVIVGLNFYDSVNHRLPIDRL